MRTRRSPISSLVEPPLPSPPSSASLTFMPALELYQLILIALSLSLGSVSLALWVARRSHDEEVAREQASALSDMEHKVDQKQPLLSSGSFKEEGTRGEETIRLLITGYGCVSQLVVKVER